MKPTSIAPAHILSRFLDYRNSKIKPSFWSPESGTKAYETILNDMATARRALRSLNITKGDPCLLLFQFSYRFLILLFALLADGALPVLIDPRLSRRKWKDLSKKAGVRFIFLTRETRMARLFFFPARQITYFNVDDLFKHSQNAGTDIELQAIKPEDPILLSFTSGTTGTPKVVSRSLSVLGSQQTLFYNYLSSLSCTPHLALHGIGVIQSLMQGSPTYFIPPKAANANTIHEVILRNEITTVSLPPGVLDLFLNYIKDTGSIAPSLQSIVTGGAALPKWLVTDCLRLVPQALLLNIYASTECEPMSLLGFSNTQIQNNQFKVIPVNQYPEHLGYPIGPIVQELQTRKIYTSPAKRFFEYVLNGPNCVANADGYRAGDILYELGDWLFYCGRIGEQIDGFPAGLIEDRIERRAIVKRAAIKKRKEKLVVFIELKSGAACADDDIRAMSNEINEILGYSDNPKPIQFQILPKMPVDPRHLWKIQRRDL